MTTGEHPLPEAAPAPPPAEVLADVVGVLGDVLRIDAARIDPRQTFRSLGMDSLLTVELVAVVNARHGTAILPTDLYDHPTPESFAAQVAAELHRTAAPRPRPGRRPAQAPPAAAESGPPASPPAGEIAEVLREQLAAVLGCDVWEIGPAADFTGLNVDSVLGAEFVATLNRTFGLRERAVVLYDHPDLAALSEHVAGLLRTAPRPPAAPGARELDVLLDAVRDDRLTVDEALVLLSRHG
ncbi:acyl carrier protein (plasmid) [Streptomyces globosus]|uniref:Acyl carrier protein n=1 Tax=Streptomyces globosus TaxID=68209 RepID=A0A344UB17_9ACTN|nr:acyl carrier protein [Streptomyces globosus]AXE28088.1 acyl carrier protein [Streptomyces globosus]